MKYDSINDAASSFNKNYCENILKPAFETKISEEVCFFFEPTQFRTYPSVQVRHFLEGEPNPKTNEFFNLIEFHIVDDGSNTRAVRLLISEFYRQTGLTPNNISKWVPVDQYDYTTPSSPVKYRCMRLKMNSGFKPRNHKENFDTDTEIRHYIADLSLYYK